MLKKWSAFLIYIMFSWALGMANSVDFNAKMVGNTMTITSNKYASDYTVIFKLSSNQHSRFQMKILGKYSKMEWDIPENCNCITTNILEVVREYPSPNLHVPVFGYWYLPQDSKNQSTIALSYMGLDYIDCKTSKAVFDRYNPYITYEIKLPFPDMVPYAFTFVDAGQLGFTPVGTELSIIDLDARQVDWNAFEPNRRGPGFYARSFKVGQNGDAQMLLLGGRNYQITWAGNPFKGDPLVIHTPAKYGTGVAEGGVSWKMTRILK